MGMHQAVEGLGGIWFWVIGLLGDWGVGELGILGFCQIVITNRYWPTANGCSGWGVRVAGL